VSGFRCQVCSQRAKRSNSRKQLTLNAAFGSRFSAFIFWLDLLRARRKNSADNKNAKTEKSRSFLVRFAASEAKKPAKNKNSETEL
jgi:hypothetical protein